MPAVLAILAEGFEEIEAIAPIDLLRRAGAQVTVATLAESIHVTGRMGVTVHADTPLSAVAAQDFDCIFLPGGPGTKLLRADPRVGELVKKQAATSKWLVAICAAPTVLNDAGLLANRRFTAHFSVEHELPNLLPNERVVIDGKIITSRGAGTAIDFSLAVIGALFGPEKAKEVGASVCV